MAGIPILLKSTHPFPIPRGQTDTLSLKKFIRKQPLSFFYINSHVLSDQLHVSTVQSILTGTIRH